MKNLKRNYMTLLLLALVFFCPGLAAYAFYTHPQWLGSKTVNKGQLLTPPVLLANINAKAKWRLILWNPGPCDNVCRQLADTLARVRLALGRRLYLVDELLLLPGEPKALSKKWLQHLKEEDVHVMFLSRDQQVKYPILTESPQLFIANPDDYLVLAYASTAKPQDIFHDIQQLLRITEKKSG